MKLFECTNGYTGSSYTRVYVIAPDEKTATELASAKLKEESDDREKDLNSGYESDYWTNVKATELCSDTSSVYVSRVKS